MCQGSFSISLSKQKRVVTVKNMIELPKNKHKSCVCFETVHALAFFVRIEGRNRRSYGHCLLERPTMASPLGSPSGASASKRSS